MKATSEDIRRLLLIEYHNLKVYTHALAIQAVCERARSQNLTCLARDRLELQSTCFLPQDVIFIHEVAVSSSIILQTAIEMAAEGRLRFIPIRQLHCIMSAFIFLFKAINTGSCREDVQAYLCTWERCVKALQEAGLDEMDVSHDTLKLLESHLQRIREGKTANRPPTPGPHQAQDRRAPSDVGGPTVPDALPGAHGLPSGDDWNQYDFPTLDLSTEPAAVWPASFSPSYPNSTQPSSDSVDFLWDILR